VRSSHLESVSATISGAQRALASGDVAAAERLCKSLIESAPQDARAWAILADTALLRNRPDAAIVCAERAVNLAPADAIAHIMRAKTLLHTGEFSAALQATRTAAGLTHIAADAADSLAALFGLLGQHRRALEFSRRAVLESPDNKQYLFNLAAIERMLGRLEDAEAHCDMAIALDRRYAPAHYVRSDLRIQSVGRNHIAEMEALAEEHQSDWRSVVMLRYALGKECEDILADDRAFHHVAAGAQLMRQNVDYDARSDIAAIDCIIATQTRSWLAARVRGGLAGATGDHAAADGGEAPIWVCGLPRTGTTLVERIIASHSAVDSVGETGVFPVEAVRAFAAQAAQNVTDFRPLGERYLRTIADVFAPASSRFVDKTLQNFLYCGLLHAALPRAKIILMMRRPMDTAWALYKAHFQSGYRFSYDLTELADYYLAYRRIVEHWKATLPTGTVLTVNYEDVVQLPREQGVRILEFLGLPWEESILHFHESRAPSATASAIQVRRPIYTTSLGKWRRHAQSLAAFRERALRSLPTLELE
jgi:Flp pilus assembly protein TadD